MSGLRRSVTEDVDKAPVVQQASKSKRSSRQRAKYASVKSGDTLSAIAKRNRTTVSQIKRLNNMKGDFIRKGQTLRVK